MVEWLALIVSIVLMLVTIAAEHEKLFFAIKKWRIWHKSKYQSRQLNQAIERLASEQKEVNTEDKILPVSAYWIVFFPMVVSSAIISLLDK